MAEDRLEKMRTLAAKARAEQEATAEHTQETEAKGAERAVIEAELENASHELGGLKIQLAEAEKLAIEIEGLPAESRAEFDAELLALHADIEAARMRVADLTRRKEALDATAGEVPEPPVSEGPQGEQPRSEKPPDEPKNADQLAAELSTFLNNLLSELKPENFALIEKKEEAEKKIKDLKQSRGELLTRINELVGIALTQKAPKQVGRLLDQIMQSERIQKIDNAISTLSKKTETPTAIEYSAEETAAVLQIYEWRTEMDIREGRFEQAGPDEVLYSKIVDFNGALRGFGSSPHLEDKLSPEGLEVVRKKRSVIVQNLGGEEEVKLDSRSKHDESVGKNVRNIDALIWSADRKIKQRRSPRT